MFHTLNRQAHLILIGTLTANSLSLILPAKAYAWFNVCNRSQVPAQVAFAYYSTTDNRNTGSPSTGSRLAEFYQSDYTGWNARGWYTIAPGECAQTYPHELWRRNRYYYVYAQSPDRAYRWRGNSYFCVDPVNRFNISQRRDGSCSGERVGFDQVDIGSGKIQNFTYNLN